MEYCFFFFYLRLAEARHLSCFSGGVDGSVNFCRAFALALFCDRALTGETPYSTEFLVSSSGYEICITTMLLQHSGNTPFLPVLSTE